MATKSKIEWTDTTWNPVRGCTKISPGCKHCYASAFAERFRGVPGHPYELGFDLRIVPHKLLEPLTWSAANMVFVNSMSDLFHPEIPDSFVVQVAEVMMKANWHTYQVLTKRAERLEKLLSGALNGLDPELYLRTVLAQIADHPISHIQDLLPWNLAPSLQTHSSQAA